MLTCLAYAKQISTGAVPSWHNALLIGPFVAPKLLAQALLRCTKFPPNFAKSKVLLWVLGVGGKAIQRYLEYSS